MNNINTITDLIIKRASDSAAALVKKAEEEQETKLASEKARFEKEYISQTQEIKADITEKHSDLLERKKLHTSRDVSKHRQELFLEVFDLAEEELKNTSKEEIYQFFTAAATRAELEGECEVLFGEESKETLTQKELDEIAKGKNFTLVLSDEKVKGESGFIIRHKFIEYNFLFGSLLTEVNKDLGGEILKKIFD